MARGPALFTPNPSLDQHQPACKPGSVGPRPFALTGRGGHSSGTTLARCFEQPTRTTSLTSLPQVVSLGKRTARVAVPIRSCSRWGLPCRFRCRSRGALLPHLFTLARLRSLRCYGAAGPRACRAEAQRAEAGGSISVALSLGLPPPEVIRHRMSMEPGLSSPLSLSAIAGAAARPTDGLTHGGSDELRQAVYGHAGGLK